MGYKLEQTSPGVYTIRDKNGKAISYNLEHVIQALGAKEIEKKLTVYEGKDIIGFLEKQIEDINEFDVDSEEDNQEYTDEELEEKAREFVNLKNIQLMTEREFEEEKQIRKELEGNGFFQLAFSTSVFNGIGVKTEFYSHESYGLKSFYEAVLKDGKKFYFREGNYGDLKSLNKTIKEQKKAERDIAEARLRNIDFDQYDFGVVANKTETIKVFDLDVVFDGDEKTEVKKLLKKIEQLGGKAKFYQYTDENPSDYFRIAVLDEKTGFAIIDEIYGPEDDSRDSNEFFMYGN